MIATMQNATVYVLGFIGLVSIGMLPMRAVHLMRSLVSGGVKELATKIVACCAMWVISAAVLTGLWATVRVFRCLTSTYCGPAIASGWVYLAMFGAVYVCFEVLALVLRRANILIQRKRIRG